MTFKSQAHFLWAYLLLQVNTWLVQLSVEIVHRDSQLVFYAGREKGGLAERKSHMTCDEKLLIIKSSKQFLIGLKWVIMAILVVAVEILVYIKILSNIYGKICLNIFFLLLTPTGKKWSTAETTLDDIDLLLKLFGVFFFQNRFISVAVELDYANKCLSWRVVLIYIYGKP